MLGDNWNLIMITSVCVFCGSRFGADPIYREVTKDLGRRLGEAGIELVYGGGNVGLMGVLADAAMAAGGSVSGYIPERLLEREVGHRAITELHVTAGMFDRKERMIEHADAFVVLPGGLGTLDEVLEVITLKQLGYHAKPIVLLSVNDYWLPFCTMLEAVVDHGFADLDATDLVTTAGTVEAVATAIGMTSQQRQGVDA